MKMSSHVQSHSTHHVHDSWFSTRSRRARLACLECRRRKVRCNVEMYGHPCTNCVIDGCECVTRNRTRTMTSKTSHIPAGEEAALSRRALSVAPAKPAHIPREDNLLAVADHEFSSTSVESARPRKLSRISCSLLPFSYYPYLRPPDLHALQQAEMVFLESQQSIHVPTQPLLKNLLDHYFLYAHQSLPILSEGEFWSIVEGRNTETTSISLLVFQAMLFVACSYIPLGIARDWGASSILQMRNTFYRRAKTLYDFGVEKDPLCRSQAAALLSYESSSSDIFGNSTWLALAIQHARLINAYAYEQLPEHGIYKKSGLKRLWWSLILRDRIISLGMRRPLQILPGHSDVSLLKVLQPDDFAYDTDLSKVYGTETSRALHIVLASQCELAVALTPLLTMIYPSGHIFGSFKDPMSALASAESVSARMQCWRSKHEYLFSMQKTNVHTSITLFQQLTTLYYETGCLYLHHHIAFALYKSRCAQTPSKLLQAATSIDGILKRFVIDGTANHLPISVVAFAILPRMMMTFDLLLSCTDLNRTESEPSKIYEELSKLHRLRYDISHVSSWMDTILDLFRDSLPSRNPKAENRKYKREETKHENLIWLLQQHPSLYFRLLHSMNDAIATGSLTLEIPGTFKIPASIPFAISPGLKLLPSTAGSQESEPIHSGTDEMNAATENLSYLDGMSPLDTSTKRTGLWADSSPAASPGTLTAIGASTPSFDPEKWDYSLSMTFPEKGPDRGNEEEAWSIDSLWLDIALFGE